MNHQRLVAEFDQYLRNNPQDTKTTQIVEWLISSGVLSNPEFSHLNLTFDIRDNRLLWVNPSITFKVA